MPTVVDNIFSKYDEVLVVGNSPIRYPFAVDADSAECVVRFNGASNPAVVKKFAKIAGKKTDICVLNGFMGGNFGDEKEFKGQNILFAKPFKETAKGNDHKLFLPQEFYDKFAPDANLVSFIPDEVIRFVRNEMYVINPTTGFLTVVYLHHFLEKKLRVVNMLLDDNLPSYTGLAKPGPGHNTAYERRLLDDMAINFRM